MVLPSIQNLIQDIKYVIRRFPLEIFFACAGTIAAIISIQTNYLNEIVSNWCVRVIMTANLGLLISLSISLYLESKAIKGRSLYLFKILPALLVASLVLFIDPLEQSADIIKFFLMSLAAHLLVSFSAYIHSASIHGFWQFNKTIFIRFLTSVLYSSVLFLGLAAAIGATKFLFNINPGSHAFSILWVFIAGIFNTIFFLAGVPGDLSALNNDSSYPKGLKVFTQYVLIPLATVYVIILLAYEAKILIEWNLPKGLVSSLVLGYAVFGILSLLLVFPIREQEENRWIKTYARSFYFLMLPLVILLFLAAGTRIFNYGITEYRYFLLVLACWLLLITIYSLISSKQNIKLIPVSLCVFTLLAVYGPQSAFSVSASSQTRILTDIFKKNNAFKDGKIIRPKKISVKDGNSAAETLRYIIQHYDYKALQPYVDQDLSRIADSLVNTRKTVKSQPINRYELREIKIHWLQNYLGLGKFDAYSDIYGTARQFQNETYFIKDNQAGLLKVTGYDFILEENTFEEKRQDNRTKQIYILKDFKDAGLLSLRLNNDSTVFNLKEFMNKLLKNPDKLNIYKETSVNTPEQQYALPSAMLSITQDTKNFRIIYKINSIRLDRDKNKTIKNITYHNGVFLIKAK
jgi:hypothetical protein